MANPFELLTEVPSSGAGLNPVLEHPLMLVHPPLLYLAQATVLAAALVGLTGSARRWTTAALAGLVAASLLGAWWAHDELGWGGWWAWDPVENTALAPLVAVAAAAHARGRLSRQRWRLVAAAAVAFGIAFTRAGLVDSVHAFASDATTSLAFVVMGTGALVLMASPVARWLTRGPDRPTVPEGPTEPDADAGPTPQETSAEPRAVHTAAEWLTGMSAGWVLLVVGSAAAASIWLGTSTPRGIVDAQLVARLCVPAGLAIVVGVAAWDSVAGCPCPP